MPKLSKAATTTPIELLERNFYNGTINPQPLYETPVVTLAPISSAVEFPNGVFVGAKIDKASADKIYNLVQAYNLDKIPGVSILPRSELHFTIIYSKTIGVLDYPLADPQSANATLVQCRPIGNALAFIVHSEWLRWRHKLAKTCGLKTQFSGYIPHISIAYDVPDNMYLNVPRFNLNVQITSEYVEPLKGD